MKDEKYGMIIVITYTLSHSKCLPIINIYFQCYGRLKEITFELRVYSRVPGQRKAAAQCSRTNPLTNLGVFKKH